MTRRNDGDPSPGELQHSLMALLKEADGLDRLDGDDLKPQWIPHDEARPIELFTQRLYDGDQLLAEAELELLSAVVAGGATHLGGGTWLTTNLSNSGATMHCRVGREDLL